LEEFVIISAPFRDGNPRLVIIGVVVGIGLFVVLAALFNVQIIQGHRYGSRENAQSLRRIRIPSARGEIVDRRGTVLANNRPSYDIAIYLDQVAQMSKRQDVVRIAEANLFSLSQTLRMPVTLANRDLRTHYERRRPLPLPVWRNLNTETVAAFEERASDLPGTDLIVTPVRQYPNTSLAAHVLGYVSKADQSEEDDFERFYYYQPDSVGIQGVERACDDFLRGAPGGHTIRVNPAGHKVADIGEKPAEVGNRVMLTIDARIQKIAEDALARAPLGAGKELRGAVVVLDPRNGEVLAMVSAPAFDPNIFSPGTPPEVVRAVLNDDRGPMLNRAIAAKYAPGSTFKPVTLLAGLEAGTMHPEDTAVCGGSLQIGNRSFGCWNRTGHGRVDALGAIRLSCDVWFYQRGMATGADAIARTANELGLGEPPQFELGDVTGLVPTPGWKRMTKGERWWDGDTAQMSIGQSFLLATPLQMANVAATLANGGTRWRPFIVRRVEDGDAGVEKEGRPEVLSRLTAKPQHVEFVRRAMLGAIQQPDGTGHSASIAGLIVAGKTGTAEYDLYENGTRRRINRVWFIGFAPFDEPQVALAVLIEDGASGGHTAAPVAREILAGIFQKKVETVSDAGGYLD
jgi:penicillin-binding protein 2